MKASKIIKDSCCGNFINVGKAELVRMVEELESKIVILENQLDNAIVEIKKRG